MAQSETRQLDLSKAEVSKHLREFSIHRKNALLKLLESVEGNEAKPIRFHESLCPNCMAEKKWNRMKLDSVVYEKNDKVWMVKRCPEHGTTKELYWGSAELYRRASRYQSNGLKLLNPQIQKNSVNCPTDCGLCTEHESHSMLANIVLTNRCDLSCWYCFFYAKATEPIYEPSLEQIRFMLETLKQQKPVSCNAIQFTGGEPTLRDDLVEIVQLTKSMGFEHIQLNTNGVNLSKKPGLAMQLREAGVQVLYMSFDGLTARTNPKNHWEAIGAIENCRKAGLGIVLVPTVIGGLNDHELGGMIRFALANNDVIRAINFQPVSLVGRMPDKLRERQRVTIPDAIQKISEQTHGEISHNHWFPIPCVEAVSDFAESLAHQPQYRLSTHFACGMATYVFKEEGKLVPITSFLDVEGFLSFVEKTSRELQNASFGRIGKAIALTKLLAAMPKFIDRKKMPKNIAFEQALAKALVFGDYAALAKFHENAVFLGMMHFQDGYNYDLDRVHKCGVHYTTPDGKITPFCTFNVLPELYRDKVQSQYAVSPAEWEKRTGKRLSEDLRQRKRGAEEMKSIEQSYAPFVRA